MNTTLLTAGIVCLIASMVGGGLKAFGIEIPVLSSRKRQVVLGLVGCLLLYKPVSDQVRPAQSSLLISGIAQAHRGPVWDLGSSDKDEVVAKVTGEAHLRCGDCGSVRVVGFWRLAQGFETNWHIARRRDEGWYRLPKIDGPIAVAGNWEYLIGGIECPKDYSGEVSVVLTAFVNQYIQQQSERWLDDENGNGFQDLPLQQALAASAPRAFRTDQIR